MDANEIGLKLLITIVLLLIVLWFCTVAFLGKGPTLELYSTMMHTAPQQSRIDTVWKRNVNKSPTLLHEQISTTQRGCFRRRNFLDFIWNVHCYTRVFL